MSVESFERHYAGLFGTRWASLRDALRKPVRQRRLLYGSAREYFLDEASFFAASQLPVEPGLHVLDMCAAPGGKSLVLGAGLVGQGRLVSNDRSADRRARLRKVLEESLPLEWRTIVQVTGHDAARWGLYEPENYDRILLDAPCSSERHVLGSPKHLAEWSPGRSRRLAVQQFAMLAAGLDALRPGGILVYSTCALGPQENDGVMEKLAKKRKGLYQPLSIEPVLGERTEHGVMILPDTCAGCGPIYCARIQKAG
ncbi:MAG TPA: RNA methyltransferase [Fibrobacteraceae bacterium]|nr:RNA methyltransferase [Fibrobacteraceae bacterium]